MNRRNIILFSFILAAILLLGAALSGCSSRKKADEEQSDGPEYIIPMSVYADEDTFSLRMIIRDCSASRVLMNIKDGDKVISHVEQDISVTKQQGINITLEPNELNGKVPPNVSAEVMIYSKANADDKLNEDPLDRAFIQMKNYVVQLGPDSVYCVADAMSLEEKAELMVGVDACSTLSLDKYGIPSMYFAFDPSDISEEDTTALYPSASVLASTWNISLAEKIGAAVGNDAKRFNADIVNAPGFNIQRDVSESGNFALYSEDPVLSGYIGSAYVNGVQSQNVGVSIGNFALDTQEDNGISERALREIYLTGFEIAVKNSSPYAVTAASANDLMRKILRLEWGYNGLVIYEHLSENENISEKVSPADFILSGSDTAASALIKAVREGELSEEQINTSCVNILRAVVRSNSFNGRNGRAQDGESGAAAAKEAAAEGMVLLKNENGALPARGRNAAVFGDGAIFLQGLKNAGYNTDRVLMSVSEEDAERAAADNDFAVICISRSGEAQYMLTESETVLIARVSEAFRSANKPVAVILNAGNLIEVSSWEDMADAILYTGFAGAETGNVAAEIISGGVNPSGRLTASLPVSYEEGCPDDIYVGYRYYETYDVETAYAFGYGLSYTTFEYSDVRVSSNTYTDSISVSVNVTNTGDMAGKDVVQLYIKKPHSDENAQPETVLASFAKTEMLEPGASQKVTLVINNYSMRSYSEQNSEWYVGAGLYNAYIAPSVKDTGTEHLRFTFRVENRISAVRQH